MQAIKVIKGLGPLDARSIGRDALLRWMVALPLFAALPVRLFLPAALTRAEALLHIQLAQYVPFVIGYALLLITPVTFGLVIGFLLLDQRDDGTLMALRVTPLPLASYLAYRLAAPMLLGVAMTLVAFPLAGLAGVGLGRLLVAALVAAPAAPLSGLALAAFAENKVQGLALMKAANVLLIAPIGAYFVPAGWQLGFGVLPTFWPARLLWSFQTGDPHAWAYAAVGIAYQLLLALALYRRLVAKLSAST